jgi:DNA-binding HxlR family transcriptional regulator
VTVPPRNPLDDPCSIARTLAVVGERWSLLILRDAVLGATRFSQFRRSLGVAPDVLADRLATLVAHGVLERATYREPGSRAREEYRLTDAGRELGVVLGALQQWGDAHLPRPEGPTILRCDANGAPLHVGFVDERGGEAHDVHLVRTAAYPASGV